MRILRFFTKSTLLALFLVLFGFLVLRESLLYMATTQMRDAAEEMDKVYRTGLEDRQACARTGPSGIRILQTVFTDDDSYQIEAICSTGSNEPIIVLQETLPLWVRKLPGESGLIWDKNGVSGVVFSILGRESTVILDANVIEVSQGVKEFAGNKPVAQCKGFGYTCCDPIVSIGEGESMSKAVDCSSDCYLSCLSRPTVLRFYADPTPDGRTRTLTTSRDRVVSYYYNIDPGTDSSLSQIEIQFGDGTAQVVSEPVGMVTHTYGCAQAQCSYTATIQATDTNNNSSIITPLATLYVQVL